MRILGLDYGSRRIGVAVSDELLLTAQGLMVIEYHDPEEALDEIREVVNGRGINRIVVGLPRTMDGGCGEKALEVRKFGNLLRGSLGIPIEFWDERLTTREAEETLIRADMSRRKRRQVLDKLAAVLILQSYLDNMDRPG